ncbi:MAG: fructose-6-phosphate aldolase [Phycisphaerales bacterium]|nr:fructose-6-phosphate aldolase [Phycisphaerales bacterium]MCB9856980.1 fructose-6-phosphate aldolase [Phycisphaerales bacterium]MCB9861893.1 fructose-6-phosphate aldolase [Phycisphaerales bacterium]
MVQQLYLDTASIDLVRHYLRWELVAGVTTNATLLANANGTPEQILRDLAREVPGPVSAPVLSDDANLMARQAHDLASIADNIVVKIPATLAGNQAARLLRDTGIKLNITFVLNPASAIPFLPLRPAFVSLILDRAADFGVPIASHSTRIRQMRALIDSMTPNTQLIAASVRNTATLITALTEGADIVTVPPTTWDMIFSDPLPICESQTTGAKLRGVFVSYPRGS